VLNQWSINGDSAVTSAWVIQVMRDSPPLGFLIVESISLADNALRHFAKLLTSIP
jgi:hypothetical protein